MKISKNMIILIIIVLLIIALIIGAIAYRVLNKKGSGLILLKEDNNYKLDYKDKYAEDDYQKVTVTDISVADNYMFIKYDVDLTNKGINLVRDNEFNNLEKFSYNLDRNIVLNGDEIDLDNGVSYQITEKLDNDKLRVFDVIEMDSIPDKFNIDIEFPKTTIDTTSEEEIEEDLQVYKEHEETTIVDEDTVLDDEFTEEERREIDEATSVYDDDSEAEVLEMEKMDNSLELELAGLLNFKGTREEAEANVEIKTLDNRISGKGITIDSEKIVTTPFAKFLIVSSKITENNDNIDPDLYRIDVQDEKQNTINCRHFDKIKNKTADGGDVTTIFFIDDEINKLGKIKLQPYFYEFIYEEDIDITDGLDWYDINESNHTAENELGGKVSVESIEEKDGEIEFVLSRTGFVPTLDRLLILRNIDNPNGYCFASECVEKDGKLIVNFTKSQIKAVNEDCDSEELQYTIMEPINYITTTNAIDIEL